ncbi:uncharacterized protein LOC125845912 [Solanum stenotomum]|uniref:uncharacterized protein LOC125845912 n=1 Tax=Solanum stenotomum TaxID=172797 RepID=UPI0020CFFB7B|nr:uncharacterized protein LOC125845912 [Solanum stenotomum]
MLTYQNPLPQHSYYSQYTQIPQPYYHPSLAPYPVYTTQPTYYPPKAPVYPNPSRYQPPYPSQSHYQPQNRPSNAPRPYPNFEKRPAKIYTPLAEPLTQQYERLKTAGILQPIQGQISNPLSRWYDETKHCAYHSGATGHGTESCLTFKDKIETLIKEDSTQRCFPQFPWDYSIDARDKGKGKIVVEVVAAGMTRFRRCYAPEEVIQGGPNKENNQKRVVTEAEVEDFWRKMLTKEYSVVEQLKKTPSQISLMALLMNSATYRNALVKVLNEVYVPAETTSENFSAMVGQVLEANKVTFHEDELLPEVVNICPFTTLRALGIDFGKIRESHVRVRGFDGTQRGVIGEIDLPLQIGPMEFIVEFQMLDISASYSLLLGRPWIHMAGAVPSILHQTLKFVWNHQEIIVHGEGQGLGEKLDGIVEPIQLPGQKYTFGLGYEPTPEEISSVNLKRKSDIPLPQPIPPLNQSFSKAFAAQGLEEAVEDNLIKGLKNLFIEEVECNMILEDGTDAPTIWDVMLGDALNNWTCNPSPVLRESCKQTNKSVNAENVTCNEMSEQTPNSEQTFAEYEEDVQFGELTKEFEHFENKEKPNFDETETINLGDSAELVRETRISVHLTLSQRNELINLLRQYMNVFAWSYDDMSGLSTDTVSHRLPIDPSCPPVKQKSRKIKSDLSLKVKEEVSKQFDANVIRVTNYPTWLANIVPVPKKDGKIRVCVDYRDLNKASPKDDFSLPNIQILIDNCAKHELQSFVDCFTGYHQILLDDEDAKKTAFITPWGVYCYRVMPFGLKNAGATYRYNLKLNFAKCAFGVPARKLLGFIVSRKGIELDPSKIKAIQDLPPPKSRKDVMSFLGRLNYICRFIAQSTVICEPIFKLLRKDATTKWTEDCQKAFDRI